MNKLKKTCIQLAIIFMRFIYCFIKLFPVKNKITMISRQSNHLSLEFKMIKEKLEEKYPQYKLVFLTKRFREEDSLWIKFKYCFHIIKQMYHIATSKVVVLDTYCMPISILNHKKSLKVIQIWHALGSLKKFGYSVLDKEEGSNLYKVAKMHCNYDIILTSSEVSRKHFADAFHYDASSLKVLSLPRVVLLKDKKYMNQRKELIEKKYPQLKNKKNILYAPTFRKNVESAEKIEELINAIDYKKYNLILKLHPLTEHKIEDPRVINDTTFSTMDMYSISDYIITDYSAIIFEVALMGKPVFFYNYDFSYYEKGRDFYIDYMKDMPGVISTDAKEIISAVEEKKYDKKRIHEFSKKYVSYTGKELDELVKLIIEYVKE